MRMSKTSKRHFAEQHFKRNAETLVREIEETGVRDARVLTAFQRIDRALFVPRRYREQAYWDAPIPIAHGQVTTQPSLVARMVEALRLVGTERVLEVGTGLGYQAAILSQLCSEVFTMERFWALAEQAKLNLARANVENVHVVTADGTLGLPDHAPFQAVILAAAAPQIPAPLIQQLAENGTLVQPMGTGGDEEVKAFRKSKGELEFERLITPASFVRLVGNYAA